MRTYASLGDALAATDARWERPFRCPVHDDHQASASVNVQKGVWYCYTCHAKGTTDGVDYDPVIDLAYLDDLLDKPRVFPESAMALYCSDEVHPYWLTRTTVESARHFQLGFDMASGRPCYPLRNEHGELMGIVTRNMGDPGPKYKYPSKVKSHAMLFNYSPRETAAVILCEGAMDVVALYDAGLNAFGIYGSRLGARQQELIRSCAPSRIICAFDNDKAGRDCAKAVAKDMADLEVLTIDWAKYEQYGDVAEIPLQERREILSSLTSEGLHSPRLSA